MRWIPGILGAALLVAVAAQPASAVVVDMLIIDRQGNPVPGLTITSNWGDGKVTTLTTDATGRLQGNVPEGWHNCGTWSEGTHVASGGCNLTVTDDQSSLTPPPGEGGTSTPPTSTSPPQTDAEKAASNAVDIEEEVNRAHIEVGWRGTRTNTRALIIAITSYGRGGGTSAEAKGWRAFGVYLADLFGRSGGGDDGDSGSSGDGNGNGE